MRKEREHLFESVDDAKVFYLSCQNRPDISALSPFPRTVGAKEYWVIIVREWSLD